ncbi:MAG TPA: hypothetical protein VGI40_03370 [Pirellulaceae bacterium]
MIIPTIVSWIEHSRWLTCDRINGSDLGSFQQIANGTRPSQILRRSFPSVTFRNDMVWLMWNRAIVFVPETVFAAPISSVTNQFAETAGNMPPIHDLAPTDRNLAFSKLSKISEFKKDSSSLPSSGESSSSLFFSVSSM